MIVPTYPTPDNPKLMDTMIELVDNEFHHFVFDGVIWVYVGSVRSLFHPHTVWDTGNATPAEPIESAEDAYDRAMGILK